MDPKDKVTFYRNDKRIVRNIIEKISQPIAWKSGLIKFSNQSFKDIANNLNIQYNIKIHFENEAISNSKFTGSFDTEIPINELLDILKASKHFEFKQIKENEWIIK